MSFLKDILGVTKPLEYTELGQEPVFFTVGWSSDFLSVRDKVASSAEALIAKRTKNKQTFESFFDILLVLSTDE